MGQEPFIYNLTLLGSELIQDEHKPLRTIYTLIQSSFHCKYKTRLFIKEISIYLIPN